MLRGCGRSMVAKNRSRDFQSRSRLDYCRVRLYKSLSEKLLTLGFA